jgi:hypothetical protein
MAITGRMDRIDVAYALYAISHGRVVKNLKHFEKVGGSDLLIFLAHYVTNS